jgi:hypothetical protein
MSSHSHPAGRSKTDLRRGRFTPAHPVAPKAAARSLPKATTHAEQALLFDEAAIPEAGSLPRKSR